MNMTRGGNKLLNPLYKQQLNNALLNGELYTSKLKNVESMF